MARLKRRRASLQKAGGRTAKPKGRSKPKRRPKPSSKPSPKRTRPARVRLDEYAQLVEKVDEFFGRVEERYRPDLRCGPGCSECCAHHLTVSVVEAEVISRALSALDAATRARFARRAEALGDAEGPCPALEADGRCGIYAARPLVCRSHGVPMRVPGNAALPVLGEGIELEDGSALRCCHLNFTGRPLDGVDPDCVLDLVNMAATLAVVNARATPDGHAAALRRIRLGDVLRAAHSA